MGELPQSGNRNIIGGTVRGPTDKPIETPVTLCVSVVSH